MKRHWKRFPKKDKNKAVFLFFFTLAVAAACIWGGLNPLVGFGAIVFLAFIL